MINHTINLVYGFEVDYNPLLENKDFNNGGEWGKIINRGFIVESISYNPNLCKPNFGETDYTTKMQYMEQVRLSILN